jgi:hypothetical protein
MRPAPRKAEAALLLNEADVHAVVVLEGTGCRWLTWILKRSFAWFDVKGRGQRLDDTPLIRINLC